ncbi:auxin efflux carrier [Tanacetum coccineum]
MGIMSTKIELTLEQSQQGVSNDVLSPTYYPLILPEHSKWCSLVFTVTNENPSRVNLKQLCGTNDDVGASFQQSLIHYHMLMLKLQRPTIRIKIQESRKLKNHIKLSILSVLPFEEGRLPVKYLGVPLVSSRLMIRDCKELIEKVQNRVQDWKNKSLSIAGRLQLIRSVVSSMHIFWASVFIIPTRVLIDIEQIMRNFLWCPGSDSRGKAKVAWDVVCLPKVEGGLGIRRLDYFNSALMDVPLWGNMTWGWCKILQLRPIVREFIWYKISNGMRTSLWFDTWCEASSLANHVSSRDIHRSGLNPKSMVIDIVHDGNWIWPQELLEKYPILNSYTLQISNECDRLEWRLHDGTVKQFSVTNIPRHAINLWLIIKRKLKTQDRICSWDVSNSLASTYPLCEAILDSHEHLFFMCPFLNDVWNHMKWLAGLDRVSHDIYKIIAYFDVNARRRSSHIVIAKLVVAASAYFIWQERNWRLFKKTKRTVNQVIECIYSAVRLKLLSCLFKRSKEVV